MANTNSWQPVTFMTKLRANTLQDISGTLVHTHDFKFQNSRGIGMEVSAIEG